MAKTKGLLVFLTSIAALTLAVGAGLFLFLPASPVADMPAGEPEVIRVNVEPEAGPDAGAEPPTAQSPAPEVPAAPPISNPLEIPRSSGLVNAPPPPVPVPPAPAPEAAPPSRSVNEDRPTWTQRPEPTIRVTQTATPRQVRETAPPAPSRAPTPEPITARGTTPAVGYWIQTGAFQSQTQAETAARRLGARGFHATITTARANGVLVFRVRLGPWSARQDAESFLKRLKDAGGYDGAFVVRGG